MNVTESSASNGAVNKKLRQRFRSRDLQLFTLTIPTTVWYILFTYLPMFGILLAFKNYLPIKDANFFTSLIKAEWTGFDNFKYLFLTPDAFIIFRNTIVYNVFFILIGLALSVAMALMISELHSKRLQKVTQTMIFMPYFLSWAVVNYFVYAFLSPTRGLLNNILGTPGYQWYMEPKYWPFIIIVLNIWKGIGYSMVVYLASITGIDQELYEAAMIDGASKWQQCRYITIPMLQNIVLILLIMNAGSILRSDIGLFYIVPRGSGPLADVTQTIDVYVYNGLMGRNNLGFSAAAALLQSVFGMILILSTNALVKRINDESALF
ncbi:MAG: ABC transporter permease subunit [Bacillota bacterium]|nr:ABC transporter permease subunit [Bacillota bacterium]